MTKIYVLIGKSGSGKDSFFEELIADKDLNLKSIVGYTTRPKRVHESEGVEYHFTDEAGLNKLRNEDMIIEERCYHTVHGDWYYFTAKDEKILENIEQNINYIYIGTVESFVKMKEYYGSDIVIPLYIEVEDGERLARALKRERKQDAPKYAEMCRRFLADCEDFSEENLEKAGISKKYENMDFEKCLAEIKEDIMDNVD
ncbi:guanylate kinase [Eubacterium sp.]|uniref:guanylate kinase n=1 Tax=Eubacterium sp. TaxID=142586 RepID=UPI000EC1CD33|nr:guanylate kinase [Eubacterium sp.]MCR5628841.1 guanylate kinase [Eubacterium sp.]HAH18596.1 guanylate kinase [Eubacterium sp.]